MGQELFSPVFQCVVVCAAIIELGSGDKKSGICLMVTSFSAAPVRTLASRLQLNQAGGREETQQRHNYSESSV